jgi:hypothetical protein
VTGATLMAIAAIASGAAGSDPRPQIADERRDSADHHHDADAARDQQLIPSPRSLTLGLAIVTIERVVQHLWEPLGSETPVRVILVKDPAKPSGYQIALITTDPSATPAQIAQRYADRWPIEVSFEDGKEIFGVGEARNRTANAVQRTVPFQFPAMDLTTIWYALYGHHPDIVNEHRARAPWYVSKTTPSFQDMLAKLRRVIIATQFQPQQARTPTTREISAVQQAWAAPSL